VHGRTQAAERLRGVGGPMSNLTGSRQPRPPYGTGPPSRAAVPTRRAPYRRPPVPVGAASRHTQVSRYRRRRLQWLVPWMFVALGRTASHLPVVTTMAVVAEVWQVMYYPARSGTLNTLLGWIGVGPEPFLQSPHQALASVVAVGIWRGAPYDMMIFLAGLATVDRNLYESAAVDGASRWSRFLHVTLPSLRPVITILFLLAALRGLRSFTEVFLLTNGGPGQS